MPRLLVACLVLLASCASTKPNQRAECDRLYTAIISDITSPHLDRPPDRSKHFFDACMKIPADVIHCEVEASLSERCVKLVFNNKDLYNLQSILRVP